MFDVCAGLNILFSLSVSTDHLPEQKLHHIGTASCSKKVPEFYAKSERRQRAGSAAEK
jgi:hypothetical protein